MKKIILLNSPIYNKKVADSEDYLPPLGLGYIATYLKKNGIDVKILDCVYENLTINEILGIIEKEKPDFVGVNIFSVNMELVKEIIEKCKTKTSFIVGGKSAKFMYNDIINFNTDNSITVTIGEGEYITLDIVNECVKEESIVKNQKNREVYNVDGNSIYFPADISKLELDRSFFEDRRTKNVYGKEEEAIVTSRECLYNCAFCGGARSLNRDIPVRVRSEQDIIKELKQIQQVHPGTQSIRILDDLFLKNEDSIKMAIRIFKQFPFEWRAMAHIKSLQGSEELFSQLEKSGCRELEIGIESGNEDMRKRIHKIGTTAEIYEVISKILETGINVKGYFMYGFPNETKEQCRDTYILAAKLAECSKNKKGKFRTSAFQFRPYHGTELYNMLNKKITYKHNDSLDVLKGRSQFNFMSKNFSECSQEFINKIVIETNKLGSGIEKEKIEKIRNCRKCKLYKNQEPLMDKKNECDIMWVGLSAKKVEDVNKNYPLENNTSSGKLIEEIEKKRYDLTFYKTNLVKCLPLNEDGKLRYPTEKEMESCIKNLLMEICELKPRVVFLLGNIVSKFVTQYCKKNSIKVEAKFLSIEHPSYICVYKRKNKEAYIKKITDEIEREDF